MLLVVMAACGGSSKPAATPTTLPPASTTTTVSLCVRVSAFFAEQTLQPRTSAKLGAAVEDGTHWYVANADGAVWITTVDPSSGAPTGKGGLLAPLNPEAVAAARFGQPPRDDPRIAGFFSDAPPAVTAINCARS